MKAALVTAFQQPPQYGQFAEPVAQAGELLVTVTAAGLHPIVKSLANGSHYGSSGTLPFVAGVDGVGRLADGTPVYFVAPRSPYGSMAEQSVTVPGMYLPLPHGLDDAIVAAGMNPGMSSWAALKVRAHFQPGESVLILGATGSAGHLAVQIAKRLGARRVIAVGRNPQALEQARELGADTTLLLTQEHDALVAAYRREIAGEGVDVVLDYLWGNPAETLLEAISEKGLDHRSSRIRYVQIGSIAGQTISLPAATLRSSGLELLGSGFGSASMEEIMRSLKEFLEEMSHTPFRIPLRTVPLSQVEQAWNQPGDAVRLVFTL